MDFNLKCLNLIHVIVTWITRIFYAVLNSKVDMIIEKVLSILILDFSFNYFQIANTTLECL